MSQLELNFEVQQEKPAAGDHANDAELPTVHEIVAFLWRSIGNNVRWLREERGLTQELLSEMTAMASSA